MLHAACLSEQVRRVTLHNSIRSWVEDVVAQPREMDAISHIVPSALTTYDLPDLAALLGDRLTMQ